MLLRALTRRGRGSDDEGVALLVAVALTALGAAMMLTMTMVVIQENKSTGRDRDRSVSVMTAEGGIDTALAQIQNAAVSSIPCGSTTSTGSSANPEVVTLTTTVKYFDASGNQLTCPLTDTMYAAQASVRSTAVSVPRGGGQQVTRTMETLVQLKPKYANDLDRAIFGDAGVTVSNNFDLYGQTGPDADVYTNGSFVCNQNEHFRGSIYAQGSISLSNSCTVDVNANAKTGFTMSNSQSTVGGDVLVSNGSANITAGTVGGKVKAVSVTPSSYCTSNPSKCVTGAGSAPAPPAIAFPQLGSTTDWVNNGYTVVNVTACDHGVNSADGYLANKGQSLTVKTLLVVPASISGCTADQLALNFKNSVNTVALNQDVAIFDPAGINLTNSLTFQSKDSTKHYLYFVQPYGSTCGPATGSSGSGSFPLGIYLGNLITMDPTISELLYSPCDVHKANQSSTYGQIYAGGTAYVDNKTDAHYVPIPVFGAVVTKRVLSYTADILYKREVLN
jgi:Tfp pilus assembly protein PilX